MKKWSDYDVLGRKVISKFEQLRAYVFRNMDSNIIFSFSSNIF